MNKIISVLLLVFLFSCNKNEEIKPFHQDIKELVFASGLLEWEDAYHVTAQTDGVLKNVNFEVGNTVAVSQVLATIDNPTNYINSQVAQEQLAISNENITGFNNYISSNEDLRRFILPQLLQELNTPL